MRSAPRGQSELLGFLLIFSVVILTIALVGITGFSNLESVQEHQRTTNAEQAFTVFADNVDDVVERGAPARMTEIKLADASLDLGETEQVNITIEDAGGNTTTIETETRPVVYDSESGTTVVYSNGAVVREDDGDSVMVQEPDLVLTDDVLIFPAVATSLSGEGRIGGSTAVQVEVRHERTDVVDLTGAGGTLTVTIEVTSDRIDPWRRYLERELGESACTVGPDGQSVECERDTSRAVVTVDYLDVRLQ